MRPRSPAMTGGFCVLALAHSRSAIHPRAPMIDVASHRLWPNEKALLYSINHLTRNSGLCDVYEFHRICLLYGPVDILYRQAVTYSRRFWYVDFPKLKNRR